MSKSILIYWERGHYFRAFLMGFCALHRIFRLRKGNYSPGRGTHCPTANELAVVKAAVKVMRLRNKIEWLDGVREQEGHFPKHCMAGEFSLLGRELGDLEDNLTFSVETVRQTVWQTSN